MRKTFVASLAIAIFASLVGSRALADSSDSARVGDIQYGNALDPTGWAPLSWPDPRGFSWLHAGMMRTPSGVLYPYPPQRDEQGSPLYENSDWVYWGFLQLGYLHPGGDTQAEFFRQYAGWKNGVALGLFALYADNPKTGQYVELRGSRLSGADQYYRLRAGQYGAYKIEAFYRDIPHDVTTNAYPLWNGVGSTNLILPAPLVPGGSTPAEVAAVDKTRPRRTIGLERRREGVSFETRFYRDWTAYVSVVNEKRTGDRPWGGPMYLNYILRDNGGALETVRPIDFTTTDVSMGLRDVGTVWQFQLDYSGSFFRNHKDQLNYQSPFALHNVVGVPQVANIYQGQFSLEPDNDYHSLRAEVSRRLKWNGRFSMAAAWGTMRQNDSLLPPVACTGTGGIFISPSADYTFNCANWNTPAALSQQTANARIDTGLLDARITLHPSPGFGWHAGLRWYREDNKTNYLAFNPLTGQYGYIVENGSQGSIIPRQIGIFDPRNPLFSSYVTQVRAIPFGYTNTVFDTGIDLRLGEDNTLNLTYSFDRDQPKYRERKLVNEQRIKLAWVDRALGKGTLRVSYEFAYRNGGPYNHDPYRPFYSTALPGFVTPPLGNVAFTTDAMRKYDLSNRIEHKLHATLIYPIGDTATISAIAYATRDDYGAAIGRQATRNRGFSLSWDWQPSPMTSMSANLGRDDSHLNFSNVGDNEDVTGAPGRDDPSLGGPLFPLANQWQSIDHERDYNAGLTLRHDFGRVRVDLGYTYTYALGRVGYVFASPGALPVTQKPFVDAAGNAFPDNHYHINTVQLGLDVALSRTFGIRVFDIFTTGSFADWHYAGLQDNRVIDHRIYTDLGPQRHYRANLVGLMLNVKL
ncbi:MAG TPA: MtrB/PioB family outer membrane beta-barrel protein [Rhodanobacteraceae bacterium]|nr:MtrB/PioB family outer membrane beta-barrel protein [Rhodanobacteraceae bacterium]